MQRLKAAMGHIELARWADLVLVAPATADFIARLSQGQADDLLSTLCLACDAPRGAGAINESGDVARSSYPGQLPMPVEQGRSDSWSDQRIPGLR